MLKCRKRRRVGNGRNRQSWNILKGQWYINITWMEQISKDNSVDFKVGEKDVSLLECVLIDPESGGLMKPCMMNDLKLDETFVEYVQSVVDLDGFTDPASKGAR